MPQATDNSTAKNIEFFHATWRNWVKVKRGCKNGATTRGEFLENKILIRCRRLVISFIHPLSSSADLLLCFYRLIRSLLFHCPAHNFMSSSAWRIYRSIDAGSECGSNASDIDNGEFAIIIEWVASPLRIFNVHDGRAAAASSLGQRRMLQKKVNQSSWSVTVNERVRERKRDPEEGKCFNDCNDDRHHDLAKSTTSPANIH